MLWFFVAALVILGSAAYLAASAAALAGQLGIAQGFAGMLLLAVTTSLPEAAVTYACTRSGAYNLAVATSSEATASTWPCSCLWISHTAPARSWPRWDAGLAVGALFAVLLMTLDVLDVLNKSERRNWILEPGPLFMVLAYGTGLYATYRITGL